MANRTVIVDNNTWNNTHIATVGTAMSSPEKAAWEIFNSLDVKYVLVVFGGMCLAHDIAILCIISEVYSLIGQSFHQVLLVTLVMTSTSFCGWFVLEAASFHI